MRVDERVFISKPELLDLESREIDYIDLVEDIHQSAQRATEITVLGGYYNVDALVVLCRQVRRESRARCRVRIAVGLAATTLIPQTWEDMRVLRRRLLRAGFQDTTIAVVMNSPVHFHTKLFRILRGRQPVWFVGSANPGSSRHEMMLRLTGRHDGLSNYVKAVFDTARKIDTEPEPDIDVRTLRDFFLRGVLCHKPPVQRIFTFDAFRLTRDAKDQLSQVIAGAAGIRHANPRAEGFGFSLTRAIGIDDALLEADETVEQRIQVRGSSIDTNLGAWMPLAYAEKIQHRLDHQEHNRANRLEAIYQLLAAEDGESKVRTLFEEHVQSMAERLAEHGIEARPVENRDALFTRFLRARTTTLGDVEARMRLSRTLVMTPMPDIWNDGTAVETFMGWAFDDLSYRIESLTPSGRLIRSFRKVMGLEAGVAADQIREALEARIATTPWADEDWEE